MIYSILAVRDEGTPQPFEQLCSHMRKLTRTSEHIEPQEWLKHLNELRSLSVLANQATEFVYNRNRTEGKTGIIKPDLIPADGRAPTAHHHSQRSTESAATTSSITIKSPDKVDGKKEISGNDEQNVELSLIHI